MPPCLELQRPSKRHFQTLLYTASRTRSSLVSSSLDLPLRRAAEPQRHTGQTASLLLADSLRLPGIGHGTEQAQEPVLYCQQGGYAAAEDPCLLEGIPFPCRVCTICEATVLGECCLPCRLHAGWAPVKRQESIWQDTRSCGLASTHLCRVKPACPWLCAGWAPVDVGEYLATTPHRQRSFTSLRSVLTGAAAGQPAKHRCLVQVRLKGPGCVC